MLNKKVLEWFQLSYRRDGAQHWPIKPQESGNKRKHTHTHTHKLVLILDNECWPQNGEFRWHGWLQMTCHYLADDTKQTPRLKRILFFFLRLFLPDIAKKNFTSLICPKFVTSVLFSSIAVFVLADIRQG